MKEWIEYRNCPGVCIAIIKANLRWNPCDSPLLEEKLREPGVIEPDFFVDADGQDAIRSQSVNNRSFDPFFITYFGASARGCRNI
jgi:hypothetical protein